MNPIGASMLSLGLTARDDRTHIGRTAQKASPVESRLG